MRKGEADGASPFCVWSEILTRADRADGFREAFFNQLGALGGDSAQIGRDGGGREHQRKRDQGETEARNARREEHVVSILYIKSEGCEGHSFSRLDVLEDGESKEEEEC